MNWIIFVVGILTLALGIYFWIQGKQKVQRNNTIQKENEQIEKDNLCLRSESDKIQNEIALLKQQKKHIQEEQENAATSYFNVLETTYKAKENEFDAKTQLLEQDYEQQLREAERSSGLAFEKYVDNLDVAYSKAEQVFDKKLADIDKSLKEHEEKLEKIKQTYAAAIEAQLREEEMSHALDFYSLHLTPTEESTIALIEELKPRLPEPRVLCMLVWQTFYQKQLKSLCAQVLHKATTVCGIYKITDKTTGQCYIGQGLDVAKRWADHVKAGLGIDTPAQNKLYNAMLKKGITNFTFELLEECPKNQLNEKEKFYIDLYQAYDYGFNSNSGISK